MIVTFLFCMVALSPVCYLAGNVVSAVAYDLRRPS